MIQKVARLIQLSIIFLLLIGSGVLWLNSPYFSKEKALIDSEAMIRDLLEQASSTAAVSLNFNNDQNLNWLVQHLVESDYIVSTSVFSHNGSQVAFAYNSKIILNTPDINKVEQLIKDYSPFIKVLYRQNMNIGYIRIRLDKQKLMVLTQNKSLSRTQYYQILMIIICVIILALVELLRMPKSWFKKELQLKS